MGDLISSISTWPKLLRVTSYCLRVADRARNVLKATTHNLTACEIYRAKRFHLRTLQGMYFSKEITTLQDSHSIPISSTLRYLSPFLDGEGLLRVGGRLQQTPLSFDEKHPIVLPKHQLSVLIATHAHLRSLHGGPQLTLRVLRQSYWLLGARNLVKNITHKCIKCVRERAALPHQLMGTLPSVRVQPSRPFSNTGVDYAGPFILRPLRRGMLALTRRILPYLFAFPPALSI